MSAPQLAEDRVSIVIRGRYQPSSITPAWLRERELLGDAEVADTTYELLIPNQAVIFQAGWLRCQVQAESLELHTEQQAEAERLRDLAVGIIKGFHEIPVALLGINRMMHFSVPNREMWHRIGDRLVHNEIWDDVLDLAGMRSVTFWTVRPDSYAGRIQIQVEPSLRFPPGVFLAYNDHYDLTTVASQPTSREEADRLAAVEDATYTTEKISVATEILSEYWQDSMNRSSVILERVWQQARDA